MSAAALTGDDDQGCEAGEGGNVQLHAMEALGKVQDGVDPVAEASHTLSLVKHSAVAEDQLVRLRVGSFGASKITCEFDNSNSRATCNNIIIDSYLRDAALTDKPDAG